MKVVEFIRSDSFAQNATKLFFIVWIIAFGLIYLLVRFSMPMEKNPSKVYNEMESVIIDAVQYSKPIDWDLLESYFDKVNDSKDLSGNIILRCYKNYNQSFGIEVKINSNGQIIKQKRDTKTDVGFFIKWHIVDIIMSLTFGGIIAGIYFIVGILLVIILVVIKEKLKNQN